MAGLGGRTDQRGPRSTPGVNNPIAAPSVKQAAEYRQHADECRAMASHAKPEHRDMLLKMAETWDGLARNREIQIARQQRLDELSSRAE
jgi:hypothetical protein